MARPFEKLPHGARAHLESMAGAGFLSEDKAATALGMPLDQFRRVIREHGPSREVWEHALSIERDALLDALYARAVEGDTKAAQTLLAVRHGVSEKGTGSGAERVHVTFNLPPAMNHKEYLEALKVGQEALPDGRK